MNTFNSINSGETGHSVRGKLNQVLSEITGGSEGINAIWNRLDSLHQYINAMDGGVGGLIKDTSYDPSSLDPHKNITLIALGPGTFSNLKDAWGRPIKIVEVNSFTIFFREAGTDYWQYETTVISPSVGATLSNLFEESADSVQMTKDGKPVHPVTKTDLVFSPDGENLKNTLIGLKAVSSGVVDISVIDSLWNQTGIYCLTSGEHSSDSTPTSVGFLIVFQDSLREHCYQRLIGNYEDPNSGFTSPTDAIYQTWVRGTTIHDGARGDWTSWKVECAEILEAFDRRKQNKLDNYKEDPSNGSVEIFAQDFVSMTNDSQGGVACVKVYNEEDTAEGLIPVARMSADKENGDCASVTVKGNEVHIDGDAVMVNGVEFEIVNDLTTGGTNKALSAEMGKLLKKYLEDNKPVLVTSVQKLAMEAEGTWEAFLRSNIFVCVSEE